MILALAAQIVCLTCQDGASGSAPSISSDGRYVAFESGSEIAVADLDTGARESVGAGFQPTISGNGRYVMFTSTAVFDRGDHNGNSDAFVWDRQKREMRRPTNVGVALDLSASGRFLAFSTPDAQGIVLDQRDGSSFQVTAGLPFTVAGLGFSANGRFVCYRESENRTGEADIFHSYLLEPITGYREQIDDGSGDGTSVGRVTNDGRFVLYWEHSGIWLKDRAAGTTQAIGEYPTGDPYITPDGRYIAWTEYPDFGMGQIVILDQATGVTTPQNQPSECWGPVLSDDASRIVFVGYAKNRADIYVRTSHIKPHE